MKISILFIVVLCSVSYVAGQTEIAQQEFWAKIYSGRTQGEKFDRRETVTVNTLKNGKLSQESRSLREYVLPDKAHYTNVEIANGSSKKTEQIEIGKDKYCKKKKAQWTKENCREMKLTGGSSPTTKRFTVQTVTYNGKSVTLYTEYQTYEEDKKDPSFQEFKYWMDKKNRALREEVNYGKINSKRVTWRSIITYEYEPNGLKIEAPIK